MIIYPVRSLCIALFAIACCVCCAGAAQESFDIELKELRPAPASNAKTPHHTRGSKSRPSGATARTEGSNLYTVRAGDHLFLILMKRYGLSNEAAERLIPEVMRLNGIRTPHGLTVGQRLIIPLSPAANNPPKTADKTAPQQTPPATPSIAAQPAQVTTERQMAIDSAAPCLLALVVAKRLGVLAPSKALLPGEDTIIARHAGLAVAIACDLDPDKEYTYKRLLTPHKMELLVFSGDTPPRQVIEKMANHLGLIFRPTDPEHTDRLPLTYIFPAIGPRGEDLRLTITPAKR